MSRIVMLLGAVCLLAGLSNAVNAQQPYFGQSYGPSYANRSHHHHHHPVTQPGYGANFGGYGQPVTIQPYPNYGGGFGGGGYGGYSGGYGGYNGGYSGGYGGRYNGGYQGAPGLGGYPINNIYLPQPLPPASQPNYDHHHHQPVNQSHPWHLGHYLLGI